MPALLRHRPVGPYPLPAPQRRLLARRMPAPVPPSVTAAGLPSVLDGAAMVSMVETLVEHAGIGGARQQLQFADSDVRNSL